MGRISLLLYSLVLYSLFLIPTGILLQFVPWHDNLLSRAADVVWQASFWHLPFCSAKMNRVILDILKACDIGLLGWLFYKGLKKFETNDWVLLWPLLCGIVLLTVIPFHSSDLYGYLNRGFQQSVFHTNPYITPIADIPGWQNSTLLHNHWPFNPCPYGVFFAQLMFWFVQLSGPCFWKAFLLFKAVNVLLVIGSTALILRIAQKLKLQKTHLAAYCFGANPLVLLHAIGNGHNDILLIFLLLLAFKCFLSERLRWLSLPLLTLSILTKYASVLALPFIVIALWKKRDYVALGLGLLLSAGLGWGLALPYLDAHHAWPINDMLDNAEKPQHSPIAMLYELVFYPTQGILSIPGLKLILLWLKRVFDLGFLIFYARIILQFLLRPCQKINQNVLWASGITMTVFIALVSAKFHPWYVVMFLPLALLQPNSSKLRHFALLFSIFQLAGFTVFQNLPVLSQLVLTILPLWLVWQDIPRLGNGLLQRK